MIRYSIAVLALFVTAFVQAHENDPVYNRVSLTVSAESEVENDTLVAVLFAEHQAQRQQVVSKVVNESVRWALGRAKQLEGVKVQTMQYSTSPVYDKKAITAWRARQSLRLESTDADVLSELIGELQERLSIGSINYEVSKTARDEVEASLTSAALAQFQRRAELVTRDLGRKSYRVVQININTQGSRPQPMAYGARIASMEAAPPPAIEAGVQDISVSVSGTIEVDAAPM